MTAGDRLGAMGGNLLVFTILISLWIALCLFYWQYRECCAVQKRERKLKKINDEMTCFVYGAAHDLKAPLRAIMQIGARLSHELHDYMDAGQHDDIALLQQRASRMSVLIDDLLVYWQAGQKNLYTNNRTVDMATLAYEIVAMLSPPPDFKIIIESPLRTMAVRYMPMQQILLNLIGNALKHHGGDKGVIRITGTDEGHHYMMIDPGRASDKNGRGIARANALSFDRLTYNAQGTQAVAFVGSRKKFAW